MSKESLELIERYRAAVRSGARTRQLIVVLLLVIIGLNAMLVKSSYNSFRDHGWPDFSAAMVQEMANVDPALSRQAARMFDRLMAVYAEQLIVGFDRNKPALVAETEAEMRRLEAYANAQWPRIEQSLTRITLEQESILNDTLDTVLTPEDAERVSHLYAEAILARLNKTMDCELKSHAEVAQNIGLNLARLLDGASQPATPVDSREIVAVMLELAGLNLQKTL